MQLPVQGQPQQPMPAGGTGAVTAPRPMMGSGAQGLSQVHAAVELMQKALVGLPMGSELHTEVLKAITGITRRMQKGGEDNAGAIQALGGAAREMQNNPQAAVMAKMFPQAGGAGGAPQAPNMGQ